MRRFYYVNPANVTDITGPYNFGTVDVVLPSSYAVPGPVVEAIPDEDLFEAVTNDITCPVGQEAIRALTFVPDSGQVPAHVIEVANCELEPSVDVHARRIRELRLWAEGVRDGGANINGFDVHTNEGARSFRASFNGVRVSLGGAWPTRGDLGLGGTPTNPVQVPQWLVDGSRVLLNESEWQVLMVGEVRHFFETESTMAAHEGNLQDLLDLDDSAGLQAYDITTGWPPNP